MAQGREWDIQWLAIGVYLCLHIRTVTDDEISLLTPVDGTTHLSIYLSIYLTGLCFEMSLVLFLYMCLPMKYVQKVSRLKLYWPRLKSITNETISSKYFSLAFDILIPVSFSFGEAPVNILFWYGVILCHRISSTVFHIITFFILEITLSI